MDDGRIGLEQHMEHILKGYEAAWRSYKDFLSCIYASLMDRTYPHLRVEEGDSYLRLQISSDACGLNKMYFLFEIGDIFPQIRWRALLRSSLTFTPTLLHKRACFLPVYAYSFDKFLTLVYWGEKQFFFDPSQLKRFKLKSFLLTVARPSSVFISAANFTWLKSVEKIYHDSTSIMKLSKHYLFNALYPPVLARNGFDVWREAPFILVGDRLLEIFTIHKTICYLNLNNIRKMRRSHLYTAPVHMLDNNMQVNRTTCLISEKHLPLLYETPMTEAIITKYIRLYDSESAKKPIYKIFLHPFESASIFGHEMPGLLTTATSLIMRALYFNSTDPLKLHATLEDVRSKVLEIFRQYPFNRYRWGDFASILLQSAEGTGFILNGLGVYKTIKNEIYYLHPSILESLSILYKGFDELLNMDTDEIKEIIISLLKLFIFIKQHQKDIFTFPQLMDLKEILKDKLGFYVTYDVLRRFILSLMVAWNSVIPISKRFCLPKCEYPDAYNLGVNPS